MRKKLLSRTLLIVWILLGFSDILAGNLNLSHPYIIPDKDTIVLNLKSNNGKIVNKTSGINKMSRKFSSLEQFDSQPFALKETKYSDISSVRRGYLFRTEDSLKNKKRLEAVKKTFLEIESSQNFVDVLSQDALADLPLGIRPKTQSNVKYTVGIAKAVFRPQYTLLTAYLKINIPKGDLIFGAQDIKLSHDGGIIGEAKLNLISDFTFDLDRGKTLITLRGNFSQPATYATITCSGFKELFIDGHIQFSNAVIHPVNKSGDPIAGYVESSFRTQLKDWNDLVVSVSLPEFGIKGINGTTFRLNNAVLDMSDYRNDSQMPAEYLGKYFSGHSELWRGVYIQSVEVVLPKTFAKRNDATRIAFGGSDLIIDGNGVTGSFLGKNLIPLEEGNAGGWQYSLDLIQIDIETGKLRGGAFGGHLVMPTSEIDSLRYTAVIRPDTYVLKVEAAKDLEFDAFGAEVQLREESYVELKIKDKKFYPKAVLH